jgi:hypothetical protein
MSNAGRSGVAAGGAPADAGIPGRARGDGAGIPDQVRDDQVTM